MTSQGRSQRPVLRWSEPQKQYQHCRPGRGRNIRLRGAIYEQSFNGLEGLRGEIESTAAAYRREAESRIQQARERCQIGTERKREENQRRHQRPRTGDERGDAVEPAERAANGRADVADHHHGVRAAVPPA